LREPNSTNITIWEKVMVSCLQKVANVEPPRDFYVLVEAFCFWERDVVQWFAFRSGGHPNEVFEMPI